MNKTLKMVGTAGILGSMLVLAGCGGGGGGGNGLPDVPDETQIISADKDGIATAGVDVFALTPAVTSGYEATISGGFKYKQDMISYPAGGTRPVAIYDGPNGVNATDGDGNVDLTWRSNNHDVTIKLTGLAADAESALTSNSDGAAAEIYKTY